MKTFKLIGSGQFHGQIRYCTPRDPQGKNLPTLKLFLDEGLDGFGQDRISAVTVSSKTGMLITPQGETDLLRIDTTDLPRLQEYNEVPSQPTCVSKGCQEPALPGLWGCHEHSNTPLWR